MSDDYSQVKVDPQWGPPKILRYETFAKMVPQESQGGQPRLHSLAESFANIGVGLIVSLLGQFIIFPLVGIEASLSQNLGVAGLFTILSVARHYIIRRVFNRYHIKTLQ